MSYHHHKVKTGAEIHRDGSGAHQLASETFLPHPCLGLREFLNCCSSHMTPQTVRRTQQVGEISHSLFTVPQYVSKCLRGESCGGMVDIIRPTYTWMIHEENNLGRVSELVLYCDPIFRWAQYRVMWPPGIGIVSSIRKKLKSVF